MKFLKLIPQTFYGPDLYAKAPQQKLSQPIKFFLKLAVIFTILGAAAASISIYQEVVRNYPEIRKSAVESLPEGLEVTVKDGKASSSLPGPQMIKLPGNIKGEGQHFNNLLVVDVETPFSAQKFREYKSMAWLTSDSLAIINEDDASGSVENAGVQLIPLSSLKEPVTVNRNTLQSLFDNIEKWSWAIVLGIGLVALMVVYLVLLFHLLYVLFLAVLVLLVGKMFAQSYSYSQAYRVALYGSVPVMIVGSVLALVPYTLPPFLPTLISLAVIGFNLSQIPSEPKTKS